MDLEYFNHQIENWIDDFKGNENIVIEALKEAATNNVCKWSYANSILKSWYQDGIKSIDDIEARRKQREASKNKTESTKHSITLNTLIYFRREDA